MRTLWLRMAEIYGHRWASSYGEPDGPGAQTWAKGLAGIAPAQLADGLSACIASADPWPPTLPEFRARCLGIPPLAAVRADIGTRATPFAALCWQHIDGYAFRTASRETSDRMLREAYEQAREHVMRGGALPAVAEALAAPAEAERRRADPAVAARHLASITRMFGSDDDRAEIDGAEIDDAAGSEEPEGMAA